MQTLAFALTLSALACSATQAGHSTHRGALGRPGTATVPATGHIAAWSDRSYQEGVLFRVRAAHFDQTGAPGHAFLVDGRSLHTPSQPAVGACAFGWVIAWQGLFREPRGAMNTDLWLRRFGLAGAPLDASPTPLSTALGKQQEAAIACGTERALVVWMDTSHARGWKLRAAQVGARGRPQPGMGFELLPERPEAKGALRSEVYPSVAFDAATQRYLVVWIDHLNVMAPYPVMGVRLDESGRVLDAQPLVIGAPIAVDGIGPQVASAGQETFVVVWAEARKREIRAARVSAGGQVIDPGGRVLATPGEGARAVSWPRIASDSAGYLALWSEQRERDVVVRARLLPPSDTLGTAGAAPVFDLPTGTAKTPIDRPHLVSGQEGYLVYWRELPREGDPVPRAVRVSRAGELLDPAPLSPTR